jgi:hypothetical protein
MADQFHRSSGLGALTLVVFAIASALMAFGIRIEVKSYRALRKVDALREAFARTDVAVAEMKALCEPWARAATAQLADGDIAIAALQRRRRLSRSSRLTRPGCPVSPGIRQTGGQSGGHSGGCCRRDHPVVGVGRDSRRPARSRADSPSRPNLRAATRPGCDNCLAAPRRLDCSCRVWGRVAVEIVDRPDFSKDTPDKPPYRCGSRHERRRLAPLPARGNHRGGLLPVARVIELRAVVDPARARR